MRVKDFWRALSKMKNSSDRWIDSRNFPSVRIGETVFYIESSTELDIDLRASRVYQPLNASGDKVFAREVTDTSRKMAVLAEYGLAQKANQRVTAWSKSND